MKLFLVLLVLIVCISCGNKNVSNNRDVKDTVMASYKEKPEDEQKSEGNFEIAMEPIYSTSSYDFDSLSSNSRTELINQHKKELNKTILSYYDQYSAINEVDSIFRVVISCDFSGKANRDLLPFYVHVLFEVLKNKNVDGYVGESIVDACFAFFNNYPGMFYQYIRIIDTNIRELLIDNIAMGFYYDDIDENELDSIFERQKNMLPDMEKEILMIRDIVKTRYRNI